MAGETSKGTDDIDFIEIIEPVLDNQMFIVAAIGGAIVGFIAYYGVMEYLKTHPQVTSQSEPEYIEATEVTQDDDPAVVRPNVPEWAGN